MVADMKNKYFQTVSENLKTKYGIDVIEDILLGLSERVICYADISDPNQVELHVISGSLDIFGFEDTPTISLSEIINRMEEDNKFAEVSGTKEHTEFVKSLMFRFMNDVGFSMKLRMDNHSIWLNFIIAPIEGHEFLRVFVISEVTELMNAEELNYEKTHKDSLTQLFNKYTFDYHYGLRFKFPDLHMFYLDLDNFKTINDQYGHQIGDLFLTAFSDILKKHQKGYSYFYRVGGDEFIGMIYGDEAEIKAIAHDVITETRKIKISHINHPFSVSIGIVKSILGEDLARKADEVLYRVKKSGKNHFRYEIEK